MRERVRAAGPSPLSGLCGRERAAESSVTAGGVAPGDCWQRERVREAGPSCAATVFGGLATLGARAGILASGRSWAGDEGNGEAHGSLWSGTLEADYFTKHHPAAHHRNMQKEFLTPQRVLQDLVQQSAAAAGGTVSSAQATEIANTAVQIRQQIVNIIRANPGKTVHADFIATGSSMRTFARVC